MTEQATSDDLATLGEFRSPMEASLAQSWLAEEGIKSVLDGAATANWLNYMGPDLIGARLSVKHSDLARARELLQAFESERDLDEEANEQSEAPPSPLVRAYRAAVIGSVVLPPLLSIYSLVLVLKHRLWEPPPGEETVNWRFYATVFFQALGLLFFWWIVVLFRN